mmetsp:Transcript_17396/g.25229  ORF Transcript_17396/g.25229 Transcript_17396/m.25229 type:complete len:436 (+) Transcript_17396:20-1327(+)
MKFCAALLGSLLLTGSTSAFQTSRGPSAFARHVKPLQAVIDYTENAQRDVYTMDEWASGNGVQKANGFQLTSDNGWDYYAMTTADIPAGTPVLYVPTSMILSAQRISDELGSSLQQAEQFLSSNEAGNQLPLFRLMVKILVEYEKGTQSTFYPWLNSLPRFFANGVSMTDACFECLPPYAAYLSKKEKDNFEKFQQAIQYVSCVSQQSSSNPDIVKWAYNVALTRNTHLSSSCKRITPLADMFNHGAEEDVYIDWDEEGNCIAYASRDIPAGSPLRASLGDPTNPSSLFATYGFLDESSPGTFCKIMHLQDEMSDLNLGFKDCLFYKSGDISQEVYNLVLYSILKFDQQQQAAFFEAVMNGDGDTVSAYHGQYFSYTLDALKEHVNSFLEQLDALQANAQSKDPATHPRVPVILAHNDFVRQTFLAVKANLDTMG